MSWMRMSIKKGQMSGELELDKVDAKERMVIILGFLQLFGPRPPRKRDAYPVNNTTSDIIDLSNTSTTNIVDCESVKEEVKAESNMEERTIVKPSLLHSERTLGTSIGEKLEEVFQQKEEQGDSFVTGIKYKDGVPHYRCRYWCKNPECRNQGNHYITPETEIVECHNCGTELLVRKATSGEALERDNWGNFFKADRLA